MGEGEPGPFQDDSTISDDDLVYRRIGPQWVKEDERRSFSSAAFDDSSKDDAMSVFLKSKVDDLGLTFDSILEGYEDCGVAELRVGDIRAAGMGVHYDGDPPGHGLVINVQRRRKSKADKKRLRDAARWVRQPPPTG